MNRFKSILVFLILSFSVYLNAQDLIIGVRYGLGKAAYKRQSDNLMIAARPTHKAGISFEFSPFYSKLIVLSGIEYETNDLGSSISIPFRFKIAPGNTFRPFFELGGYYAHPLHSKQTQYILTRDIGISVGGGFMYAINKRWRIELGYLHRFGFKGFLGEEIQLPAGQISYEQYDMRAGGIDVGVKFRF